MALIPTVSVAGQAFPAVTSPQSFVEIPTPVPVAVAAQPLARPSDVGFTLLADIPTVNVSLQSFLAPNRPDFLVLPNRKTNLPQNDPISPIVLQVTAWPAANRITVKQATRGIILPPLSADQLPSGYKPDVENIDLTQVVPGFSILGRQILMVDKPTFLTPVQYRSLPSNSIASGATTHFASDFSDEVDGAFIIGISGTDTLVLSKNFQSSPVDYWLIIDQRLGFEVEVNDFAFQGSFTPDPFLPYLTPTNAPFNGDLGTFRPQFEAPPAFSPDAPQALPPFSPAISPTTIAQPFIPNDPQARPPITQTVNPSNQAFDGLPDSFFQ
jgi:hypothetical protein